MRVVPTDQSASGTLKFGHDNLHEMSNEWLTFATAIHLRSVLVLLPTR